MTGFHLPGDPYFPNQENGGWIEEDPAEDPEEVMEEEPEDEHEEEPEEQDLEVDLEEEEGGGCSEGIDLDLEVYNSPRVVRYPAPRLNFQGSTPRWVVDLRRWSQEKGQHSPYGMERDFYNLSQGGSVDRALPIIVHHVARHV